MAWEEDSISSLDQSKWSPQAEEEGQEQPQAALHDTNSFEGELSTSSLSCDDEKYEAFSLNTSSRRGSTESIADDSIDCNKNNGGERLSWWRPKQQQQQETSHDTCCKEEERGNASTDSSQELQNAPQSVSETISAADEPEESPRREQRPSAWWKLSFRRKTINERGNGPSLARRNSIDSSGSSAAPTPSLAQHTPSIDVFDNQSEDELNRLLFPRRGSISQNSHQSKTSFHSLLDSSQESHDTVDNVVKRHSVHLNSIERALLADMVHPNENRWKKLVHNSTATTILEEEASSSSLRSADSKKKDTPTVATMIETQMSPDSDDFALSSKQPDDANSWDEKADEDGLYCNWSVVDDKGPIQNCHDTNHDNETRNTLPDALPNNIHDSMWDTEQLLALKDGVSLARFNAIDDVSSIVSSEHSGRITTGSSSKGNRISHRQSNRRSFVSTLGNLKGSILVSKSKMSTRANAVMGEYEEEDEEEDRLEDELFAAGDAKHAKIVKDAMALMDIVNKSVISMGIDSPFRNIDEVCPPFRKIHKNILSQLKEHDAVSIADQEKLSRASVFTVKHLDQSNSSRFDVKGSFTSNASDVTGKTPNLNDRKAVATYIMNRITSHESASATQSSHLDAKRHTAYLPNFMYYQFIAADKDSIIKPTSLCHGTGITGGDQYLHPDMLSMFEMFGSYLVGAGHLVEDNSDDESNDEPKRTAFYMEPIHEGESYASSNASIDLSNVDSDDELFVNSTKPAELPAELSIELLESILNELKQGQSQDMLMKISEGEKQTIITDKNNMSMPLIRSSYTMESKAQQNVPARENEDLSGLPKTPPLNNSNDHPNNIYDVKKMKHREMGYY